MKQAVTLEASSTTEAEVIAEHGRVSGPMAQPPPDIPVIHCVYREGLSTVFASQVLEPTRRLACSGVRTEVMVSTPVGEFVRKPLRQKWKQHLSAIHQARGPKLTRLPSPPSRLRWLWRDERVLERWLRQQGLVFEPVILHCRGPEMASRAASLRRRLPSLKVVFDCRGLPAEEFLYANGMLDKPESDRPAEINEEVSRLESTFQAAVDGADAVLCVSRAMSLYLADRMKQGEKPIAIVPCCTDLERFTCEAAKRDDVRADLGFSDRYVVAYLGSMHRYQQPQRAIRFFKIIQELKANAALLAVTTESVRMRSELSRAGVSESNCRVVSVPPSDVPRYLSAADLGLLPRERCVVNRVASPVKFAEYLASGTPVLMTPEIGDYSEACRQHGLGVVVDQDWGDQTILEQLGRSLADVLAGEDVVQRCIHYVKGHLTWEAAQPTVARLYGQVAEIESGRVLEGALV